MKHKIASSPRETARLNGYKLIRYTARCRECGHASNYDHCVMCGAKLRA
jgi:predicted Zn-ribbon and HTH transcriptional regulator